MTLDRKALRSVRKNLSFYLVTCFLTVVAVTMLTGALTTAETIGDNCEEIYGNLNVEDAQFVTDRIITDEDILRYETDFDLILERQNYTDITEGDNTIRLFRESSKVNLSWIFETGDGEVHDVVPSAAPDGNPDPCRPDDPDAHRRSHSSPPASGSASDLPGGSFQPA